MLLNAGRIVGALLTTLLVGCAGGVLTDAASRGVEPIRVQDWPFAAAAQAPGPTPRAATASAQLGQQTPPTASGETAPDSTTGKPAGTTSSQPTGRQDADSAPPRSVPKGSTANIKRAAEDNEQAWSFLLGRFPSVDLVRGSVTNQTAKHGELELIGGLERGSATGYLSYAVSIAVLLNTVDELCDETSSNLVTRAFELGLYDAQTWRERIKACDGGVEGVIDYIAQNLYGCPEGIGKCRSDNAPLGSRSDRHDAVAPGLPASQPGARTADGSGAATWLNQPAPASEQRRIPPAAPAEPE